MSRILLSISFLFIVSLLYGQETLPNVGFEEWTTYEYYEEPSCGVWTTANKAILLNPAVFKATTFKTDDAHSGNYAAKMLTDIVELPGDDLLVTGTLATGVFDELALPPNNLYTGAPFTARPYKFELYYKYISIENDSCDIWAISHKWNTSTQERDTIGVAWVTSSTYVDNYTLLSIPFVYHSDEDPDSVSVVFASSAAGDIFAGQVGSTLYVDDISFVMSSGIRFTLMPEVNVTVYPNPASNIVTFEISETIKNGQLLILDINGHKVKTIELNNNKVSTGIDDFAPGNYIYQLFKGEKLLNGGSFLISNK